jgi:hypothetical protein
MDPLWGLHPGVSSGRVAPPLKGTAYVRRRSLAPPLKGDGLRTEGQTPPLHTKSGPADKRR